MGWAVVIVVAAVLGFVIGRATSPGAGGMGSVATSSVATQSASEPSPDVRVTAPEWLPAGMTAAQADRIAQMGDYPGQPAPGTVLWGASVRNNADPDTAYESPTATYGVRRTFFQWDQATTQLLAVVRDDMRNERLPWVSIKTPSWQEVADGVHDRELDALLEGLRDTIGPVWLTMHHEPDGGGVNGNTPDDPGGPAAHKAMNRHVRVRLDALGVSNVALAPVLMSWTFNPASGRNPDDWWVADTYDFLGVDVYNDHGGVVEFEVWSDIRLWAGDRDVDVAIGEWGVKAPHADAFAQLHAHALDSAADNDKARLVAASYWDNDTDSNLGWTLSGDRVDAFVDQLTAAGSASWVDMAP